MNILIVKTSSLGDIIHCFPVLTYLKQKFPVAKIDWIVEKSFAGLLENHPLINRVHCVDTKKWRRNLFKAETWKSIKQFRAELTNYDIVFDLQGNSKSALITWAAKSPVKVGFGKKTVPEWPNILATNKRFDPPIGQNIRKDYLFLVQSYFNDSSIPPSEVIPLKEKIYSIDLPKPLVMVCPGSAWPNKQLAPSALKRFLELLQKDTRCSYVFIWGNEPEKALANELYNQFSGHVPQKLSLPELQSLMTQMNLIISMDSLPLHLAGTTNTPTFSIFGPSVAEKYRPLGVQHNSLQGECPYGRTFEKRCPILRSCPTGACIRNLDGDLIYQNFLQST